MICPFGNPGKIVLLTFVEVKCRVISCGRARAWVIKRMMLIAL